MSALLSLFRCSTCRRLSLDVLASGLCWRCLAVRLAIGKAGLPAESRAAE